MLLLVMMIQHCSAYKGNMEIVCMPPAPPFHPEPNMLLQTFSPINIVNTNIAI